ncbi:hypothetical protein A2U01_0074610, partial [Trifolium medium]|nr:hypothetical protein [Trifolium medium]
MLLQIVVEVVGKEKAEDEAVLKTHTIMFDSSTAKPQARGYNASSNPSPPHFNPYARPTAHLAIPQYYT